MLSIVYQVALGDVLVIVARLEARFDASFFLFIFLVALVLAFIFFGVSSREILKMSLLIITLCYLFSPQDLPSSRKKTGCANDRAKS